MAKILTGNEQTKKQRLAAHARFVAERENVRLLKEAGRPRPWTKDNILQTFHFCNMKRADDRVTKFIGDWLPKEQYLRWFACCVARWFNEPDTLEALSPAIRKGWHPDMAKAILGKRKDEGRLIFRASYIINGALANKGAYKYITVCDSVLSPLWKNPPAIDRNSCENSWLALREYPGQGSFMAGQIVADWNTFSVIHGKDSMSWAPLGPGSARGLQWIFNVDKVKQDRAVELMQEVHANLQASEPAIAVRLNLHDIQNTLCEFSKYVRGYSKTKYQPFDDKNAQESFL